jgi:hypothetical protein
MFCALCKLSKSVRMSVCAWQCSNKAKIAICYDCWYREIEYHLTLCCFRCYSGVDQALKISEDFVLTDCADPYDMAFEYGLEVIGG